MQNRGLFRYPTVEQELDPTALLHKNLRKNFTLLIISNIERSRSPRTGHRVKSQRSQLSQWSHALSSAKQICCTLFNGVVGSFVSWEGQ